MSYKITILYGSYLENRNGIRAVKYLEDKLTSKGHMVTVADAQTYEVGLIQKRVRDYPEGACPENLKKLQALFRDESDAFIVVAGEYNGAIQPGLANMMDHFVQEFSYRPCGIVTYSTGPLGGARMCMNLLALLNIFAMSVVPGVLSIPKIHETLDKDGVDHEGALTARYQAFSKKFDWFCEMFRQARKNGVPE